MPAPNGYTLSQQAGVTAVYVCQTCAALVYATAEGAETHDRWHDGLRS